MPEAEGNTWTVLTKHTSLTAPLGMLTICKLGIAASSRLYASLDAQPRQHAKNRGFRKDLDEPEHGSCVSLLALPQLPAMFLVPGLWEARNCLQIWHLLQHVGWGSSKAACCSSPSKISKKWQPTSPSKTRNHVFAWVFVCSFLWSRKREVTEISRTLAVSLPGLQSFPTQQFPYPKFKSYDVPCQSVLYRSLYKYDWWTRAGTHVGFSQSIGLYSLSSQHDFLEVDRRIIVQPDWCTLMNWFTVWWFVYVHHLYLCLYIYIVLPFECYILNFI